MLLLVGALMGMGISARFYQETTIPVADVAHRLELQQAQWSQITEYYLNPILRNNYRPYSPADVTISEAEGSCQQVDATGYDCLVPSAMSGDFVYCSFKWSGTQPIFAPWFSMTVRRGQIVVDGVVEDVVFRILHDDMYQTIYGYSIYHADINC